MDSETLKGISKKSSCTPIRRVTFSSESDNDDVFLSNTKKYPKMPITLIDSDDGSDNGGNEFRYFLPKTPKLILSSSDSDDDVILCPSLMDRMNKTQSTRGTPLSNASFRTPASRKLVIPFSSDSEEEDYTPLSTRVLHPIQMNRGSLGSSLKTPTNKKIISKPFYTEKITRNISICKWKGCFLSSLDIANSTTSGKNFKKTKADLTKRLFNLFNESVFDQSLPKEMEITWAKRLTKTAGVTKCRRITKTIRSENGTSFTTKKYEASISLSEKVLDSAYRLRDTLIHELCHAAVWLLNNVNESHGPFWKSWANKARRVHPELPSIDRCHNYDIEYKYIYQCTRCDTTIGRHSKSIDITKKVCGRCSGKLVLNPCKRSSGKQISANPFAKFVQENYNPTKTKISSSSGSVSHKDVMKSLSDQFKSVSVSN